MRKSLPFLSCDEALESSLTIMTRVNGFSQMHANTTAGFQTSSNSPRPLADGSIREVDGEETRGKNSIKLKGALPYIGSAVWVLDSYVRTFDEYFVLS